MRALAAAVGLAALTIAATAARAEGPLTAEAFEALTQGRTMTWAEFGSVYGVEQYLSDRRVRWTVLGDDCKTGHWYGDGSAICFVYEDQPDPVCWEITEGDSGLSARHTSSSADRAPVLIEDTNTPMACFGPEVGV